MVAGTSNSFVAGAFLALATATIAQQTTLSIPFFGYDNMPIDASIVAVQNHVTTMALKCAPGTDSSDCGLAFYQTLIIGPSTYNMNLNEGTEFTMTQDCTIHSAQSTAVCAESAGGSGANFPGSSTTTYNGTDYTVIPVTATAGVTALGSNSAPATTATTTASSSSETSSGTTGAVTSSAPTVGQSATSHGASSTSSTSSATGSRTSSASASPSTGAAAPTGFSGGSVGVVGALVVAVGAALL